LTLNLSALPSRSDELRAAFEIGVGNNNKPMPLLYPDAGGGAEPQHIRYAVYMNLTVTDGTAAGKIGQLVVTAERIMGMFTHGSAGGVKLDESAGSVYGFALGRDDIQPVAVKTRWTGRTAGVVIRSREDQSPAFALEISSVVGVLADTGRLSYGSSLAGLMDSLTPEARTRLGRPPAGPG